MAGNVAVALGAEHESRSPLLGLSNTTTISAPFARPSPVAIVPVGLRDDHHELEQRCVTDRAGVLRRVDPRRERLELRIHADPEAAPGLDSVETWAALLDVEPLPRLNLSCVRVQRIT